MLIICPIAGVGSRLHPLTINKPKAMIKIAGKRILAHLMEKLKATFPARTKICFIVGYKKKTISQYLTNSYSDYFDIIYREQRPMGYKNEIPYFSGLGDAIGLAEPFGKEDDCFIFLSDRLPIDDYSIMLKKMEDNNLDGIINVRKVNDPQHYGVCVLNEKGIITKVAEKPKNYISDLAISGAYMFSKRVTKNLFSYLNQQADGNLKSNQEHQFTPIIQKIINDGAKIGVNIMEKPILDFGRVSKLLEGNRYLLKENPDSDNNIERLKEKGKILNVTFIPPVFIGKNCVITNSVIGPNVSLGDNVILKKCVLDDVIVGDCSSIENVITSHSVIGDYVTLEDLVKNEISIGDSSTLATNTNF